MKMTDSNMGVYVLAAFLRELGACARCARRPDAVPREGELRSELDSMGPMRLFPMKSTMKVLAGTLDWLERMMNWAPLPINALALFSLVDNMAAAREHSFTNH